LYYIIIKLTVISKEKLVKENFKVRGGNMSHMPIYFHDGVLVCSLACQM